MNQPDKSYSWADEMDPTWKSDTLNLGQQLKSNYFGNFHPWSAGDVATAKTTTEDTVSSVNADASTTPRFILRRQPPANSNQLVTNLPDSNTVVAAASRILPINDQEYPDEISMEQVDTAAAPVSTTTTTTFGVPAHAMDLFATDATATTAAAASTMGVPQVSAIDSTPFTAAAAAAHEQRANWMNPVQPLRRECGTKTPAAAATRTLNIHCLAEDSAKQHDPLLMMNPAAAGRGITAVLACRFDEAKVPQVCTVATDRYYFRIAIAEQQQEEETTRSSLSPDIWKDMLVTGIDHLAVQRLYVVGMTAMQFFEPVLVASGLSARMTVRQIHVDGNQQLFDDCMGERDEDLERGGGRWSSSSRRRRHAAGNGRRIDGGGGRSYGAQAATAMGTRNLCVTCRKSSCDFQRARRALLQIRAEEAVAEARTAMAAAADACASDGGHFRCS